MEHLVKCGRVLGARKRGLAVEHEERDTTADLPPAALDLKLHLLQSLVVVQHRLDVRLLQSGRLPHRREVRRVREDPIRVVHLEDPLGEVVLHRGASHLERVLEQRVPEERVWRTVALPGEVDPDRLALSLHVGADAGIVGCVGRLGNSLQGSARPEHVRTPDHLGVDRLGVGREGLLELPLADPAPGSDDVREDFDADLVRHVDDCGDGRVMASVEFTRRWRAEG
ncbi:hypothetical protein ACHAWF_003621 [Thalassiosira exigua]